MKPSKNTPCAKTLKYALCAITILCGANSYAAISQSPLSLTIGVPPNMLLTLDDSGSMRFAFSPDGISGTSATRRAKSSAFNPLYYNPSVTYKAPTIFTTAGAEQALTSSFTRAWHNGFNTGLGSIDLSKPQYRVTWDVPITNAPATYNYGSSTNYTGTGAVSRLGQNPAADFNGSYTMNFNGTATATQGSVTYTINRSNRSCTATASHSTLSGDIAANCSVNNNTVTVDLSQSPLPAYYYTYRQSDRNCNVANDDCYTLRFVNLDEQQNFANWYSFYRNRALATISAASLAFYDLSPSVRLSWQALNRCTSFTGKDANCGDNAFKAYSPDHKGQLYNWLRTMTFDSGTPLPESMKRAGEFYRTATPWQANPNGSGNTAQNTYACRASYHILMTDGIWNATTSSPSSFRHDDAGFTLPDGKSYTRSAPYADGTANTLADLAMHYWATDLNTNLDNRLTPFIPFKSGNATTDYWDPRNDPANWQHMTNFTMGLGLTQSLDMPNIPWAGSTFAGPGYSALKAGTASWPSAGPTAINANVYDLWHAAINSRGEFFSVDSPEAMVQAFADILSRIADRKSTAARPAINSGQVSTDEKGNGTVKTVSYQSSYASDDNWSGDIKRFEKSWNTATNSLEMAEIWSAKNKVPATANRNIKIAGSGSSGLVDFNSTNAASARYSGTPLLNYLNRDPENANSTDTKGSARISYLRGDRTGEGTIYRQRSGVLGDFYSSTPAVVLNTPRYLEQFSNRLEKNTRYSDFKAAIAKRSPRVYVGGNDGMLHGFNALTGLEEFAFIPSAVFPKLNKLTGKNYTHDFYVEGSPVVADVYTGTEWRTILVGTLKAGGKSVFALDITEPGKEKLLWQFDENSITAANAVKMGYSFSQPTIARLHTGKWAVLFGNGYESANNTNGKAALLILDAMQGTLLKSLEVQGTNGIANGLSTPKLGDFDADGVADYAYAGDLQGNMWRFDLLRSGRSPTAPFTTSDDATDAINEFKVAFEGNPLFRATADDAGTQRQAITSAPSLVTHPTGVGYLVIFGTGRFFDTGDKEGDKSMAQTVYGIWDKQTLGQIAKNPNIARSSLQQQSIKATTSVSANGTTAQGRVISDDAVRWEQTIGQSGNTLAAQNGWLLTLVQSDGEMVVENMSQLGRTIFFQSLVPNDDPCGDGASNWTYAINPYTGGRTIQKAFDYIPTNDVGTNNISAIRQDGEGGGTISQNPDSVYQYCTGQSCITIYPDPTSIGRQSWRRLEEQEAN